MNVGALSELVQISTARDTSLKDLASDMMGAVGFMCVAMGLSRGFSVYRARRVYLLSIGLVSIVLPLTPLLAGSAAYVERAQTLPTLVRFDSRLSELLFTMQHAIGIPVSRKFKPAATYTAQRDSSAIK